MGTGQSCCEAYLPKEDRTSPVQEDVEDLPQNLPNGPKDDVPPHEEGEVCSTDLVDVRASYCSSARSYRVVHFGIEEDLLRGIPLRASLRRLGKLWVTSPIDLSQAKRALLWQKSRQVERLDIFLSHTWNTPGWHKVLALTVQLGSYSFLIGWLLGVLVGAVLDATMDIPNLIAPGPTVWLGGLLGSVLGLLASPYIPAEATCRRDAKAMCFLDVACINQADPELMERGIYSLGGFLAVASELRVLWSRPYLTRLWCVFELAAFRKANPSGRIVLRPLFVENGLLCVVFGIYILKIIDEWRFNYLQARPVPATIIMVMAQIPSYMLFHVMRRLLKDKHQLMSELRNFDIEKVGCRTEEDKEYIHNAIRSWYGSPDGFSRHVRGPLADELTRHFSGTDLPGSYWLMIATPFVSFNIAEFWIECQLPTSTAYTMARSFLVMCIGNSVLCVHYIQLVYFVCHRFAAPAWGLLDYGKTFAIWFFLGVVLICLFGLGDFVRRQTLAVSILYSVAAMALSLVIATRAKWRLCCRSRSPSEETLKIQAPGP